MPSAHGPDARRALPVNEGPADRRGDSAWRSYPCVTTALLERGAAHLLPCPPPLRKRGSGLGGTQIATGRPIFGELPRLDSNQERGNQNPLCYHYTTGYDVSSQLIADMRLTPRQFALGIRLAPSQMVVHRIVPKSRLSCPSTLPNLDPSIATFAHPSTRPLALCGAQDRAFQPSPPQCGHGPAPPGLCHSQCRGKTSVRAW